MWTPTRAQPDPGRSRHSDRWGLGWARAPIGLGGAGLGKSFWKEEGAREGEKQNKGEKKIRAQTLNLFRVLEGRAERDEYGDFGFCGLGGMLCKEKKWVI